LWPANSRSKAVRTKIEAVESLIADRLFDSADWLGEAKNHPIAREKETARKKGEMNMVKPRSYEEKALLRMWATAEKNFVSPIAANRPPILTSSL
jgi:hypothetical protein